MSRFLCIKCGKKTRETKCHKCGIATIKMLDRRWTRIVGTRFRTDDMKYGIDDYPERKSIQ